MPRAIRRACHQGSGYHGRIAQIHRGVDARAIRDVDVLRKMGCGHDCPFVGGRGGDEPRLERGAVRR